MRTDRLEKLASYLDNLPNKNFNFLVVRQRTQYGTVGCAMGHLPEVFPDDWQPNGVSVEPKWIKVDWTVSDYQPPPELANYVAEFFDMSVLDVYQIFYGETDPDTGYYLYTPTIANITPQMVARAIRDLIAKETSAQSKVRDDGGWWEVMLMDLEIAADGESKEAMLRQLSYVITAEYHIAKANKQTPFANLIRNCPPEVRKDGGKILRTLNLPDDVRSALAAAFCW